MSGGSMNYLYSRIENDAVFPQNTAERKAFAAHLKKVAKALHDIEWVDSCDYSPGMESEAIRACLKEGDVIDALIDQAKRVISDLQDEVKMATE